MKTNIYDILFWIFFVVAVITVLWYIFGGSPTFEQAVLILILTFLFINSSKVTRANIKLNLLEKRFNNIEDSFVRLVRDFKEHIKHK